MEERTTTDLAITGSIVIEQEKEPDLGEDATISLAIPGSKASLFACLDGCGGSGARQYPAANNRTGAWLASRVCGHALNDWFKANSMKELGMQGYAAGVIASSMKQALDESLFNAKQALGKTESVIISRLIKEFPTTLAAVLLEQTDPNKVRCLYLWAGDSRGFLFTTNGLRQMTVDDVIGNLDPHENLRKDGILSNVISLGGHYELRTNEIYVDAPCMAITATDGCFSYYSSPIELEGILLYTLMAAKNINDWERQLTEQMGEFAADDYTMQIAIIGFQTFDQLQRAYLPRTKEFREKYGKPLEQMKQAEDWAGMEQLWMKYKVFYMTEESNG